MFSSQQFIYLFKLEFDAKVDKTGILARRGGNAPKVKVKHNQLSSDFLTVLTSLKTQNKPKRDFKKCDFVFPSSFSLETLSEFRPPARP